MRAEHSTEDLIRRAQGGESSAQAELTERHLSVLEDSVRARLGSHLKSCVEVSDVVQETFEKALRTLPTFEWQGEGSFLRWLRGIATNEILRLAKRERYRDFIAIEPSEISGDDTSPSRGARRVERFDRLERALESLSPDHREVIVLARIKGLRLAEVAERTGRTPNAVAQLLGRALANLKEAFGDTESLSLPAQSLDPSREGRNPHER